MQVFVRGTETHTLEINSHQELVDFVCKVEDANASDLMLSVNGAPIDFSTLEANQTIDISGKLLGGRVHGSLARAGKVKGQTPKVEKEEKKKKKALKTKVTAEEMDTSVDGCRNSPKGWQDSQGQDCDDYASGEWCTRYGRYDDGWLDEWGSFEDRATDGKAATQACCVCGGGISKNPVAPAPADASAAPSPAEAAAPSPGPAPGPGVDYTMAYRPLQEQGFHGDLVMHEDQETMTGDWGREFGPQSSGHKDLRKICADHPGNEWCLKHFPPKSSAMTSKIAGAAVALCLIVANGL